MEILNDLELVLFYLVVGLLSSSLIFFLIYIIIMRVNTLTIFDLLNDSAKLMFIYTILILTIVGTSLLITVLLSELLNRKKIDMKYFIPSLAGSLIMSFVIIGFVAYGSLYVFYPKFFYGLEGIELLLVFPSVLINFSNFILNHPFGVIIMLLVIYHLLLLLFLEFFT
jgi:hypothetical protein